MSKRNLKLTVIVYAFIALSSTGYSSDFNYNPYPVIVVHGFGSSPLETWGTATYKVMDDDNNKFDNYISTRMREDRTMNPEDHYDKKRDRIFIARDLINEYDGFSRYKDSLLIYDGMKYQTDRFIPYEEENSYSGFNHTFVEPYCSYFRFESNDSGGVERPFFSIEDASYPKDSISYSKDTVYLKFPDGNGLRVRWYDTTGYEYNCTENLSDTTCDTVWDIERKYDFYWNGTLIEEGYEKVPLAYSWNDYTSYRPHYDISHGGQTQLLRIRIIQVLNEYYGDFKWVNDPSAKVILVGHSNGVVLITNLLKNEKTEDWHNDGRNLQGCRAQDVSLSGEKYYTTDGEEYKIDGYGFKLRDHVDRVVAFNGPFSGTSLANKDGKPSNKAKQLFNPIIKLFDLNIIPDKVTAAIIEKLANYLLTKIILDIGFGGSDNPLFKDDAPGSNFINNLSKDGTPPLYSDGSQIPYFVYASKTLVLGKVVNVIASAIVAHGIETLFRRPARGAYLINLGASLYPVADWLKKSDFVIDYPSQKMKNAFPETEARIRADYDDCWHKELKDKSVRRIMRDFSEGTDIRITHAIGSKQTQIVKDSGDTISTLEDTIHISNAVYDSLRPDSATRTLNKGIQFINMSDTVSEDYKWRSREEDVIVTNANTGMANIIAGKVNDYFMNRAEVECKVNFGNWKDLGFYNDEGNGEFGKYACRHVDFNCDGKIDEDDGQEGAMFFARVSPYSFHIGSNLVRVRLKSNYGSGKTDQVQVLHKIENAVAFEASDNGKRIQNELLYQAVQWRDTASERTYTFGFTSPVDTPDCYCQIDNEDSDTTGSPVEYSFTEPVNKSDDYESNYLMNVKLNYEDLMIDTVTNSPVLDQTLLIHSKVADEGSSIDMYFPFIVDNEKPVVSVNMPGLRLDLNNDGRVDSSIYIDTTENDTSTDDLDGNGVVDSRDYFLKINEGYNERLGEMNIDTTVAANMPESITSTECDGIDNDGDGYIDDDDLSEWNDVEVYTIITDGDGNLESSPVHIQFHVYDNAQSVAGLGDSLIWSIRKSGADELVYSDTVVSPQLGTHYSDSWDFKKDGSILSDPEGAYYLTVRCRDRAGNVRVSDSSYFIVDTTSPGQLDVIDGWSDNNGKHYINSKSETFGFSYRPAVPVDRYDTETEYLEIRFIPVDNNGDSLPSDIYKFTSYAVYEDNVSFDSTGLPVFEPDGVVDSTVYTLACKENSDGDYVLPDGRYKTKVTAYDRAGNSTGISELSGTVVVVDRHAPIVYEYAPIPDGIMDDSEEAAGIKAKICESHDDIYNKLYMIGEEYSLEFFLDDTTNQITPENGITWTEEYDDLKKFSIDDFSDMTPEQKGQHAIIVKASDTCGNSSKTYINFFYKNYGLSISSPGEYEKISGTTVIRGNITDPDRTNSYGFEKYVLKIQDESGALYPQACFVSGGSGESHEIVNNNSIIGYFATDSVPNGQYDIIVDIFEENGDSTTLERTVNVENDSTVQAQTNVPVITKDVVPLSFDSSDLHYNYSYNLSGAVSDVNTRIVNESTNEIVFSDWNSSVIPLQGIPAAENDIMLGLTGDTMTVEATVKDISMSMIFNGPASPVSADISFNTSRCAVDVQGSMASISDVDSDTADDKGWSVRFYYPVEYGDVQISSAGIATNTPSQNISVGSDELHPGMNPFTIKRNKSFTWDGTSIAGSAVDNGDYKVYISAVSTYGGGYDEVDPATVNVQTQPDLKIDTTSDYPPEFVPSVEPLFARFSVNKVCDVFVSVIKDCDPNPVVIKKDTLKGVVSGTSGSVIYEWNGIIDNKGYVSEEENIKLEFAAWREQTGERDTLVMPVVINSEYNMTPDSSDPLIISGGKKGFLKSTNDSLRNCQVVSGNVDAKVDAEFEGQYYKPVDFGYKAVVGRKADFSVSSEVRYTSKVKIRGLTEIYRKDNTVNDEFSSTGDQKYNASGFLASYKVEEAGGWKAWLFEDNWGPDVNNEDQWKDNEDEPYNNENDQYSYNERYFPGWDSVAFDADSVNDYIATIYGYPFLKFRQIIGTEDLFADTMLLDSGFYNIPGMYDNNYVYFSDITLKRVNNHGTQQFHGYKGVYDTITNKYYYQIGGRTTSRTKWNGDKIQLRSYCHFVFYKDYPWFERTDSVRNEDSNDVGIEKDITLNWNDWSSNAGRYIKKEYPEFPSLLYNNSSDISLNDSSDIKDDFFSHVTDTNTTTSKRDKHHDGACYTELESHKVQHTYTLYGSAGNGGSIPLNDTTDHIQVWLHVKPSLKFSEDKKLILADKQARGKEGDGVPYMIDGNGYFTDSAYVYKWVLDSTSGDIESGDSSLISQFSQMAQPCTLMATTINNCLRYKIVNPNISEDEEDTTPPNIVYDTISPGTLGEYTFSLDRGGEKRGYGPSEGTANADTTDSSYVITYDIPDSVDYNDIYSLDVIPVIFDSSGGWEEADSGLFSINMGMRDSLNVFSVEVNDSAAGAEGFIEDWPVAGDDTLLTKNNGRLSFNIPAPEKIAFWDSVKFSKEYDKLADYSSGGRRPLFEDYGATNPDILITKISADIRKMNGDTNQQLVPVVNHDTAHYENSGLGVDFNSGADNTNMVGVEINDNYEENLPYFNITVSQYGREDTITGEIDNSVFNFEDTTLYWDAGDISGEVLFKLNYYNDTLTRTYAQTAYIGHCVGDSVYGDESNFVTHSPYRRVELIYNENVTTQDIEDTVFSSDTGFVEFECDSAVSADFEDYYKATVTAVISNSNRESVDTVEVELWAYNETGGWQMYSSKAESLYISMYSADINTRFEFDLSGTVTGAEALRIYFRGLDVNLDVNNGMMKLVKHIDVFKDKNVSSIRRTSIDKAFIKGLDPKIGQRLAITDASPVVTATPSPAKFDEDMKPMLYYRYLREEVESLDLDKNDIPRIYHINNRTGALTDITTGFAEALDYTDGHVFNASSPDFKSKLTNNEKWDFLQLTALPPQFSNIIPLQESYTILDRVELEEGVTQNPDKISFRGSFVPYISQDSTLNPEADGFRLLFNFNQNASNSSSRHIDSVLQDSGNYYMTFSRDTIDLDTVYSFDIPCSDIEVPAYMGDRDTIFVYGYTYNDSLGDSANTAVGYAEYVLSTVNTGFNINTENRYLTDSVESAWYNITPDENGTLTVLQYGLNGDLEDSYEKKVFAGETVRHSLNLYDINGNKRKEGTYTFEIMFSDEEGNVYEDTASYSFVIDYTVPAFDNPSVIFSKSTLVTSIHGVISDNYALSGITMTVDAEDGFTVDWIHKDLQGTALELDTVLNIRGPLKYEKLSVGIALSDSAGNVLRDSLIFDVMKNEDYTKGWKHSKQIDVKFSDEIKGDEPVYDFPVLVELSEDNFEFSLASSGGKDVRFSDVSGNPLFFDIEQWDSADGTAQIWVKIPVIEPGIVSQRLVMHWGNPNADNVEWMYEGVWDKNYRAVYHLGEPVVTTVENGSSTINSPEDTVSLESFALYSTEGTDIYYNVHIYNGLTGSAGSVSVGANSTISSDIVSGGGVLLAAGSRIAGNITAEGDLNKEESAVVLGEVSTNVNVSDYSIPVKTVNPGSEDVTVAYGGIDTLQPGQYNDLMVYARATLYLKAGTYNFRTFRLEPDVTVIAAAGKGDTVEINVKDDLDLRDRALVKLSNGLVPVPERIRFYTDQSERVDIHPSDNITGVVSAPNAEVHLHPGTNYRGAIYARHIVVEPDVNFISSHSVSRRVAAYSLDETYVKQRAGITGDVGSNGNVTVGAVSALTGDISSNSSVYLYDSVSVYGSVTAADNVVEHTGVEISGEIQEGTPVAPFTIEEHIVNPGAENITVPNNTARVLEPGSYNEFMAYNDAVVRLQAGEYHFRKFRTEPDVNIEIDISQEENVTVLTSESLDLRDRAKISFINIEDPSALRFYTNQSVTVNIHPDDSLAGLIYAPHARIHVHPRTYINGTVYGKSVIVEPDVYIEGIELEYQSRISMIPDAASGNHHGENTGSVNTEGYIGDAQYFDGIDDYVNVGPVIDLPSNKGFTLSGWILRDCTGVDETFASKFTDNLGWQSGFNADNKFSFTCMNDTNFSLQNIDTAEWIHVAVSVEPSGFSKMYINGEKSSEFTTPWHGSPEFVPFIISMGLDSMYYTGKIDELRISDTARSSQWINMLYSNQNRAENTVQIPHCKPEGVQAVINSMDRPLFKLDIPESVTDVVFERRIKEEDAPWTGIEMVTVSDSEYVDENAVCGIEYEYRVRYLDGSAVSPWSDLISFTVPDCYTNRNLFRITAMVVDSSGTPLNSDSNDIVMNFFESIRGDSVIKRINITSMPVHNGWLSIIINKDENGMDTLMEEYKNVYSEIAVNGAIQTERRPLSSRGVTTLTSKYHHKGEGPPAGRVNAPTGSLYFDLRNKILYFKYGSSINDWKDVR